MEVPPASVVLAAARMLLVQLLHNSGYDMERLWRDVRRMLAAEQAEQAARKVDALE